MTRVAQKKENTQATMRIDILGSTTMLHLISYEIKLDENIAEALAAIRSKGQKDNPDNKLDREYGYGLDLCPLVQAEITVLAWLSLSRIQSIIIHKTIDCHPEYLFSVLCEEVEAITDKLFATCFLQNEGAISSELNAEILKTVG